MGTRLGALVQHSIARLRTRVVSLASRARAREGQALVETVMTTGFLVALALVLDKTLIPIVAKAFEHIANALSSVGP